MAGEEATGRTVEWSEAFVALIARVEGELQGRVRRVLVCGEASRDIVQKTYLAALGDARFDPAHPYARAWLFSTAKRLVLDLLGTKKLESRLLEKIKEISEITDGPSWPTGRSTIDDGQDAIRKLIQEEDRESLGAALACLDEDDREVLDRYYLREEGTQAEVAAAMELSGAAFNSRLMRARKRLKTIVLAGRAGGSSGGDRHVAGRA